MTNVSQPKEMETILSQYKSKAIDWLKQMGPIIVRLKNRSLLTVRKNIIIAALLIVSSDRKHQ